MLICPQANGRYQRYVFLFHHQTKTDLKFMCRLVTQNQNSGVDLSCVNDRMTTNLILGFGKPVSIKSLFNRKDKSLFLNYSFHVNIFALWLLVDTFTQWYLQSSQWFLRVFQQLIDWVSSEVCLSLK